MIYFVMSAKNEYEKMSKIQEKDIGNSYLCREMFSHFDKINVPKEAKKEAIKDFITVLDGIIVIGEKDESMNFILAFAADINMEVQHRENTE